MSESAGDAGNPWAPEPTGDADETDEQTALFSDEAQVLLGELRQTIDEGRTVLSELRALIDGAVGQLRDIE
jgi:hypothetical protein